MFRPSGPVQTPRVSVPPPIRRSSKYRPHWILLALFVPPLVLLVLFSGFRLSNARAVNRLEARIRERGEPLSTADIQARYPPIPDGENAAVALMDIWERGDPEFWKAFRRGERHLPEKKARPRVDPNIPFVGDSKLRVPRHGPLPEEIRIAAERYLSANLERMQAVREALRRPRCRFQERFADGFDMLMPHLTAMKGAAVDSRLEALLASDRGDVAGSLAALRDVVRVGDLLADDPTLIGQLVRIACHTMAIDGGSRLLSRQNLRKPDLDALQAMLDGMAGTNLCGFALRGERVFDLQLFDLPTERLMHLGSDSTDDSGSTGDDKMKSKIGFEMMRAGGLMTADRRLMLETLEEAIRLADTDSPEALVEFRRLFEDAKKRAKSGIPRVFSGMTLPALGRVAEKFATLEAMRRSATVAVAVERYRSANGGNLPDDLGALVPAYLRAVPSDPFDGRPIRFKKRPTGYVVYSIGADSVDNGGIEKTGLMQAMSDVVIIVER